MTSAKKNSVYPSIIILLLLWGILIFFVNPVGEFMVNDDWAFTTIVENLLRGHEVNTTGWGDGGPSVLFHVVWGLIFSKLLGYSTTTLRISVLTLSITGTVAFFLLLRQAGNSRWFCFGSTLILLFNPLFLSQSFTFMTDITFASMMTLSLLFLHRGIEQESQTALITGLVFTLLALLTRQIGLVIPVGFLLTCFMYRRTVQPGFKKLTLLTVFITLLPWMFYETFLWVAGSSPISSHPVVHKIFTYPADKGFPGYPIFLLSQGVMILMYTAFFLSPLLVLRSNTSTEQKNMRKKAFFVCILFLLFETCRRTGLINPANDFHGNIIYNFGIGPILLKDFYLLNIPRLPSLPKPLFFLLIFLSIFFAIILCSFLWSSIKSLFTSFRGKTPGNKTFLSSFTLVSALLYFCILVITEFHDRYLIPFCILLIIWLTSQVSIQHLSYKSFSIICSAVLLFFFASTSLLGLKDFMSYKRGLHRSHQYLLNEINVNPCEIDGGFEFNGYHCSTINLREYLPEYSWWWVKKEKYLVTLGPLQDYRTVKKFPFRRHIGPNGAIHVLKPEKNTAKNR